VDLFVPYSSGGWGGDYTYVELGQRYKRPVLTNILSASNLRSRNLEGYVTLDNNELNELISLLQVRKSIRQTKMLIVSEGLLPRDVPDNAWDLEDVKARFGVDYHSISLVEFFNEMDRVVQDKDEQKKVEVISDKLIKNAQKVNIDKKYVMRSVSFYVTAKNLMQTYGCNAFTIPCCDTIPNTMATERKIVPCLAHSLLKDEGIPSSCQYDVTSLLTMMVLMYISKKSTPMGNPEIDLNKNTIRLWHDVPGTKMHGLNKPDLPYELRNFTPSGWGTNLRYDFARDTGEKVTLARFNPLVTKILAAKGEIAGCDRFNDIGCTLTAVIKVSDIRKLTHKLADFGAHLVMVYGDYSQELKRLADIMKFEVEVVK
jgi:L-fucose isomerase-like protein